MYTNFTYEICVQMIRKTSITLAGGIAIIFSDMIGTFTKICENKAIEGRRITHKRNNVTLKIAP